VLVRDLDAELQAAHGLALADFEVLLQLRHAPVRRLRMSELADATLLSRSGLTRLVDRLERRGLVYRHRPPEDVRQVWACLSDDGLAALAAAERTHVEGVARRFWQRLDEPTWRPCRAPGRGSARLAGVAHATP